MEDCYLTLNEKSLRKFRTVAKAEAKEFKDDEDSKNTLSFSNSRIEINEVFFDEDKRRIDVSGNIYFEGESIGYIDFGFSSKEIEKDVIKSVLNKFNKISSLLN